MSQPDNLISPKARLLMASVLGGMTNVGALGGTGVVELSIENALPMIWVFIIGFLTTILAYNAENPATAVANKRHPHAEMIKQRVIEQSESGQYTPDKADRVSAAMED